MGYYQVLGVHRDASAHAIKQAYRRLAFQNHPDRNPRDPKGAERRMQVINEAYDVLSDSVKRRQYDLKGFGFSKKEDPGPKRHNIDPQAQQAADDFLREFETNLRDYETSRFESKDGIFAMVLAFLALCQWPVESSKLTTAIGLVLVSLSVAMVARALTRAGFRDFSNRNPDSFLAILISNTVAAFVMTNIARSGSLTWSLNLFEFNPVVTVLSVLLPSVIGAAFGRAFNSALGAIAGILGSAVIGGTIAFVIAMWALFLQAADEKMMEGEGMKTAFIVTMVSTLVACSIGSLKLQSFGLFSVLDFFESVFERFSRRPAPRALVVKKD